MRVLPPLSTSKMVIPLPEPSEWALPVLGVPTGHLLPLDGLRGIAVLAVLSFHFAWAFAFGNPVTHAIKMVLWSGWFGVDLFFVLSGFLITRGLVATSKRSVGERLKLFWGRRFLRIFPLYYIVLIAGGIACFVFKAPLPEWSYWAYVQNYALAIDPNPERWTSHLWSLAIEEQFYLFWPLVALMVPRRRLLAITFGLFVFGVILRTGFLLPHWRGDSLSIWADPLVRAKLVYRATPTHMDGLLLGAALAILSRDPNNKLNRQWRRWRVLSTIGSGVFLMLLILWTRGFNYEDRRVIVLGYPALALLFSGLMSLAVDERLGKRVGALLVSAPLRACGRVSYGMYIFHWPVVALLIPFFKVFPERLSTVPAVAFGFACLAAGMVVTYAVADLSFRYIESPFLKLKTKLHD